MLERLKRLFRSIAASSDDDPESFDHPRPQRVNPAPPARDWYARVKSRSFQARAVKDTKTLEALDAKEPVLSREASQHVDEVLAKMGSRPPPRS